MSRGAPWLAIDTATDIASVALGAADHVTAELVSGGARRHAAQIVPLIQELLRTAGARVADLGGIVVGDGPGSFTGLRIAWAAAKGIVQERGLPLHAIPTLLGAAHAAARGEPGAGPVAACFDALRGQVFGAVYAFPAGRIETIVAPGVFTLAALAEASSTRPRAAVGDGATRYPDAVRHWTGRPPLALSDVPPIATSLLLLLDRDGAIRPLDDPAAAEPVYGRPAEAQAKWEARHGRPLPHTAR